MNRPADWQQRQQAATPALSVHVEAPAGSGKTSVLLERFLRLLAQAERPEALLALTFTKKAAGELRARLYKLFSAPAAEKTAGYEDYLLSLAQEAVRRHVNQGWAVLQERLQIMTFHSFCARLLRQLPHAAGLPPDFRLLDDYESQRLREEASEETRRRLGQLPPADPRRRALVNRLVRLNNNWPRLAGELRQLVARRDILEPFLALARHSQQPAAYEAYIRHQLHRLLTPRLATVRQLCLQTELGQRWPEFHAALANCGSSLAAVLPPELPGTDLEAMAGWQQIAASLLTKEGSCFKSFSREKFPPELRRQGWCEMLANLPAPLVTAFRELRCLPAGWLHRDEIPALQDLVLLLSEVLQDYQRLCRQRGAVDFIDLELATLRLLEDQDPADLLLCLDYSLSHLLIDEFQDTSLNQLELLCRLTAGWTAVDGRTLMVVGDPKQAIYEWRNARLELFHLARQGLPCPRGSSSKPLTPILLTTNFRSTQTLIHWVNELFGQTVMAAPELARVEFHRAAPAPAAALGEPPLLALFADREAEARWLARQLLSLLAGLNSQEKVGILFFARTHLRRFLQELWALGIKPRVRDGLPLRESRAVRQVHNLVTALVRPHDAIAWAAFLPGFGRQTSLAVLEAVAAMPATLWPAKLHQYAAGQPDKILQERIAALLEIHKRVGRQPLAELVLELLDRLDGWEVIAAWEGAAGVANVRYYLDLLTQTAAASPEETLAEVSAALTQAYQPPDPLAQDSPVEILTVHAAKGLEFEYVWVPCLDYSPLGSGPEPEPFLLEEDPATGMALLALSRPAAKKDHSLLYHLVRDLGHQRRLAEARRLFYVAVTRAKKRLWLSGKLTSRRGELGFPARTPLGWLGEHYHRPPPSRNQPELWPDPPLQVILEPELPIAAVSTPPMPEVPAAWELQPDPWPYRLQFPSQFAEASGAGPGGESEAWAQWRGEITHRLLETVAYGRPLPPEAAVAAALQQKGIPGEAARELAREILAEVNACLEDEQLRRLLDPALQPAKNEWLLEGWQPDGTVVRGQVDRVVFDGRQWWLLDYKTSRPASDEDWEDFIRSEGERYRPQLLAYRELVANLLGQPATAVQPALYFTARRQLVLL